MIIKHEMYGFTVEIDKRGRAPVILTFEELPVRRASGKKHYYCCIDIGLYEIQSKTGKLGFSRIGSFEIKDWFNYKTDTRKRNKLKSLLGVVTYENLVNKVASISEGKSSEYIRTAQQYG